MVSVSEKLLEPKKTHLPTLLQCPLVSIMQPRGDLGFKKRSRVPSRKNKRVAFFVSNLTRSPIFNVIVAQSIVTVFISAGCFSINMVAFVSAVMAGVSCVVPGLYTLALSLRPVTEGNTGLGNVVKAELGKFALTGSVFALVFVFVQPLNVMIFFGTFVGLQVLMVGALWFHGRNFR